MKKNCRRAICFIMTLIMMFGCTSSSACALSVIAKKPPENVVRLTEGEEYVISCEDGIYTIRSEEDIAEEEDGIVLYRFNSSTDTVYERQYGVEAESGTRGEVPDAEILLGEEGDRTWTAESCAKGFLFRNEEEPDRCIVIRPAGRVKLKEQIGFWWKTRNFENVLCLDRCMINSLFLYNTAYNKNFS